ncbi:malate synthase A [Actinoalloteichus hymeniacidonis]|uniref:Malate synthase n=1 Tax=Actinoalloteichus hymeniacidonis TaxID=340345 RepID=A0AAC9HR55_9PSEU|nr:malate synthase A [Actinoalloteichus hymeniacidonis]AOS64054.1 malate synthase [Actinoalloteichus hymeniacidonis]MBB5907884.1 malate synthase [Actinoalloteichus hymeniacidonis]
MSDTAPLTLRGTGVDRVDEVFTPEAIELIEMLHRRFEPTRVALLAERGERERRLAAGGSLDFLPETREIREDPTWTVPPPAPGLEDRRVEITGPTDRKMTINALNSGAKVWLADFEDANTPSWANMIDGQLNLRAALEGTLDFVSEAGKAYTLGEEIATIVVRPRGWHLIEKHVEVDGTPVAGGLVDFALYLVHCGRLQIDAGRGPYYYLPKLEGHREARLWNDVFTLAEQYLGLATGTIRATVLIETIPAAFEMEEILYELRDHSAGLNAGRWDYLFSIIKKFREHGEKMAFPDRSALTMTTSFMRAYTELLVTTCHRRGAHAIGGMAAAIPSRRDPDANAIALAKVREDKTREAGDGFDGSWVAHPDLVPVCREVFDGVLGDAPNQLDTRCEHVDVDAGQLLDVASVPGRVTTAGLHNDVAVGLRYLESWLRGSGAVAIFGLMEDAATAEISRSLIWQWVHTGARLEDDTAITPELIDTVITEQLDRVRGEIGEEAFAAGRWTDAEALFRHVALTDPFVDFLTVAAYDSLD